MRLTVMAFALVAIALAGSGDAHAATVNVNVGDNWFCNSSFAINPCPTTIAPGDTITWNWVGNNPHTSTACSDGNYNNCAAAQGWDSGVLGNGATFSRTFNTAGTFFYRCNVHPSMRGRIEVIQDSDADGWSDAAEVAIGTDPADRCADNAADNAWPADINNDTFSDISDIVFLTNNFGAAAPPAPVRYNVAPDPPDAFIDITDISRLTGLFGQSCAP
jgi:plastocyanin